MRERLHDCGYGCPIEAAMDVIGGRWKGVILYHLLHGTRRFGELRSALPAVSTRILTLQLRELEAAGVIRRDSFDEVPLRVEYSLTPFGTALGPTLLQLRDWGEQIMGEKIQIHDQSAERPEVA